MTKNGDDSMSKRMTAQIGSIVENKSKRMRTTCECPKRDRISSVPLVLSRKWKCIWMSIYNIEIDDIVGSFSWENAIASFTDVVTRILLCTQNSRLKKFHLYCDRTYHFSHLENWISDLLMRNVQNLNITARKIKGLDSPSCFSGWTSLTVLILFISCTLEVPANNCFPNLKRLFLSGDEHGGIKIMTTKVPGTGRVVLNFSVLAMLHLVNCEWLDVNSVEIQAPGLLHFGSSSTREFKNFEIKICGSKLEGFELSGRGPVYNHILSASQAVTFAALSNKHTDETSVMNAHKILTKFSNLKCLRIHGKTLKGLLHLKPRLRFPTFNLLKELECKFNCDVKDVLELLQVLPSLETLIIQVATLEDYEFSETSKTIRTLSQLKRVKLLYYSETTGQYNFAKYLLENANNLEKMAINLLYNVSIQSLTKLKPKSLRCEIVAIQEEVSPRTWFGPIPTVHY